MKSAFPEVGSFVADREGNQFGKMVVLHVASIESSDDLDLDHINAAGPKDRPSLDDLTAIVTVSYATEIMSKLSLNELARSQHMIETVQNAGIQTYTYPASQLKPVQGGGFR